MNPRYLKILIFTLFFLLIFSGYFIYKNSKTGNKSLDNNSVEHTVEINGLKINVEIADTSEKLRLGLGKRQFLEPDKGMLFIFPQNSQPLFWMKDMLFPIDIIWINDGKIIKIDHEVPAPDPTTPDEKLPKFGSTTLIDHVLEVNSGFCEKNNIEVGNTVKLPNPK